jgi:hypothetical protein
MFDWPSGNLGRIQGDWVLYEFDLNLDRMLDEEVQKGDELRQKVEKLANELEAERRQRIQLENRLKMGKENNI